MVDVVDPKLTLVTGVAQQWEGGAGVLIVNGTIGGSSVAFYLSDDNATFFQLGSSLDAIGMIVFAAPRNSWLKVVATGGSPTLTYKVYREAGLHAYVQNPISAGGGASSSVDIASFGGAAITKGQKTMAGSMPVVLASDYSISTSSADMNEITGTIGSAAVLSNFPVTTTAYHKVAIQFTTVTAGNTAVVEESNDNTTWTTLASLAGVTAVTAAGMHVYNFSGKQVRVRCSIYASGSVAVTAEFRALQGVLPMAYGAGAIDARTQRVCAASDAAFPVTGTFWQTTQPVSGTFWQATQPVSGTFWQATQPVSIASMPSTPVTGTFWQATQPVSIATAPVLVAGSAIIGKVGIDQTTPGTTDSVTVASAQGMGLVIGAKADAKSTATDTTSISAMSVWKQISASVQAAAASLAGSLTVTGTFWQATQPVSIATAPVLVAGSAIIGKIGIDQTTPGTTDSVTVAVAQGMGLNFGLKADAKSSATDTTSISAMSVWKQISFSIQAIATSIALQVFGAGTAAAAQRVTLASDDPAVATLGATSGAKVITDANGTLQQYLRGLVSQWVAGTLVIGTGSNVIGIANQGSTTPILVDALSSTVKGVLASTSGILEDYYCYNPNVLVTYVQIFDIATTGGVTVGTTVPKWSIAIPPSSAANLSRMGLSFANGIQVAATTTAKGSTAPVSALDCNFGYR